MKTINVTWFNDGSAFFQMRRTRYFSSPTASLTAAVFEQILKNCPSYHHLSQCIKDLVDENYV